MTTREIPLNLVHHAGNRYCFGGSEGVLKYLSISKINFVPSAGG